MNFDDLEIQRNRNLVKSSTHPMPKGVKGRPFMDRAESNAQIKQVANDPSANPAGKGKFSGAYAPFADYSNHYTYATPDASHAARLRGAKSKKSWEQRAKTK